MGLNEIIELALEIGTIGSPYVPNDKLHGLIWNWWEGDHGWFPFILVGGLPQVHLRD